MPEKNMKFDTRLNQRNHKRKKNTILNILIGVVILLIIIVTVNIVTGDDERESAEPTKKTSEVEEENAENGETTEEEAVESEEEEESVEESTDSTSSNEETASDTEENEADTVTTEPSNDSNVESVVIDSGWQPIGTEQSGEHVSSYTKGTIDWKEKVNALAYAASLDPSNMYVQFIGNGGSPQKSIGTVTSKDRSEIYRISLEWVDGEGWKPTKKEILKSLQ